MQHCTPEQLALAALHEPLPDVDAAHLETCSRCRSEVVALQRSVDALAVPEFASSGTSVPPPPSVWAGIAAATGVSAAPRPDVLAAAGAAAAGASAAPVDAPPAAPLTAVPSSPAPGTPRDGDAPSSSVVRPLRPRRTALVLAAAASLLVGAGLGAGAVALTDGPGGDPVAAADLAPLEDSGAAGTAAVVAGSDGRLLQVELDAPPLASDGYYEVWLIEPSLERMVPVGVVREGSTTLEVPEGLDIAEYAIVDVSVEPLDGDPTHSGDSVARGILGA
ncbi:anti-sigma factor [Geodermatophilus sp. YIM 151500]|uniref:anti-sigma factor n=1 Tax=Geodermatophilus sp. YIM 151500 TaxID=2984531 RepID=UPI0021E3B1EA|nr:anti-sigma factor [Geodermatophilus sp. YIM 151500]MCV2490521.1 anti-sigma factor [Geodermatophilus sp. YIM 151500]